MLDGRVLEFYVQILMNVQLDHTIAPSPVEIAAIALGLLPVPVILVMRATELRAPNKMNVC
jgi:hypothetical protein